MLRKKKQNVEEIRKTFSFVINIGCAGIKMREHPDICIAALDFVTWYTLSVQKIVSGVLSSAILLNDNRKIVQRFLHGTERSREIEISLSCAER